MADKVQMKLVPQSAECVLDVLSDPTYGQRPRTGVVVTDYDRARRALEPCLANLLVATLEVLGNDLANDLNLIAMRAKLQYGYAAEAAVRGAAAHAREFMAKFADSVRPR